MGRFIDIIALASAIALSAISCAKEGEDQVNDGTKNKVSIYDITLNNLSMSLKTLGLGDFLFQLVISKKVEKR